MELANMIEQGYDVGITPDGPRGPKYEIQPGAVTLAAKTGSPVVPIAYDVRNRKVLGTWDRFRLPFPFTRGRFVLGEPFYISGELNEENTKKWCGELKNRMSLVHNRAQMH